MLKYKAMHEKMYNLHWQRETVVWIRVAQDRAKWLVMNMGMDDDDEPSHSVTWWQFIEYLSN
jgi:hypothetical protein